jgi:hypothetical protein
MSQPLLSIPGYEGIYSVSDTGLIYSERRKKYRKTYLDNQGYIKVVLCVDGEMMNHLIHRLVAMAFIPNPVGKPCVNHIDGNKGNNHVSNLEWCDYSENRVHSLKIGTSKPARGKQFKRTKLCETSIGIIREAANNGFTHTAIACYFIVGRPHITQIVNRKEWSYVS